MAGGTPIPTPFAQRAQRLRRGFLPMIVWLAAVALFVVVAHRRGRAIECVGWAQADSHTVASTVTGRIETIAVGPLQFVTEGEVVVLLDDRALHAEILQAQAAVKRLQSELASQRARALGNFELEEADWQTDLRRFQAEEETYRLENLRLRTQQEVDGVERQRLELQLGRYSELVQANALSAESHDNAQWLLRTVERRIEENQKLLAQTQQALEEAESRRTAFEARRPDPPEQTTLIQPFELAIEEQERRVDVLTLERRGLTLRSPISGQVTGVLHTDGNVVRAGEPILVVTGEQVDRVVAYIRPDQSQSVEPEMTVQLRSAGQRFRTMTAGVSEVGASIERLPERLWRTAGRPEFGRPFTVNLRPGMSLLPGEPIRIRLLDATSGGAGPDS
jgi:multidrug resistance efflux pump